MASHLTLEGKIAFVTGGTRGIGWGIASRLAKEGAIVFINGASDKVLLHTKIKELQTKFNPQCDGFSCPVQDRQALKGCYDEIFKRHKRLDILVNNAGILEPSLLAMASSDSIDKTLDVNVKGVIYNMQYASRLMARNNSGVIINISSVVGQHGAKGLSVYSASKAAVIGLTLSAALELGAQHIRVNAVAPGFIDTEMVRQTLTSDQLQEKLNKIHMNRLGTPEEVANAVYFLVSDQARYITGFILGVNGGMAG